MSSREWEVSAAESASHMSPLPVWLVALLVRSSMIYNGPSSTVSVYALTFVCVCVCPPALQTVKLS